MKLQNHLYIASCIAARKEKQGHLVAKTCATYIISTDEYDAEHSAMFRCRNAFLSDKGWKEHAVAVLQIPDQFTNYAELNKA